MKLFIHTRAADVGRFAEVVRERGDSEREALGFLPRCVYSEAAAQGKLFVATLSDGRQEFYAGHLMFGGKFPHLRVFQVYVLPEFRHRNVGRDLVEALATDAENRYYITISSRVAADLPANEFWERAGFHVVRTEEGGATTGRRINVRRRDLDSPTLFSNTRVPQLLARPGVARVEQPIYALDINVLLDVIKDRPRAEYASRLLTAAMSGILRLFVAPEFVNELSRAAQDPSTDPVVRLAMSLPQFTPVPDLLLDQLKRELADLVFSDRARRGALRPRDNSDMLHLATTIYHSASGFVTSDDTILRQREELRAKYAIDVVGPAELAEFYLPRQWTAAQVSAQSPDGKAIEASELTETRRTEIESFLQSCGMPVEQIGHMLSPGQVACPRHRVVVSLGGAVIGFASWEAARGPKASCEAWLVVEPLHPMAELACDVLFEAMSRDACAIRPTCLLLNGVLASREVLESAVQHGFRPGSVETGLAPYEKLCVGGVITTRNWSTSRRTLSSVFGFEMPETPPHYLGPSTAIQLGGRDSTKREIPLLEFEAHCGPAIFMLTGRPVTIVPIQRPYADQLLSTGMQSSLFPLAEAAVRNEKLYLSSPRTLAVLSPGTVILFYESIGNSRGRGAIVAAATVVRTAIRTTTAIDSGVARRGVLSPTEIGTLSVSDSTALTFFSQLMRFESPVILSRLRALGCVDGANLVTARQIDGAAAMTVIEEGRPSAKLS